MTLRVGQQYRGYRILNGDGTPVVDTDGAELWVTRCGLEVMGNRTDGLSGNMHPVVKLGTLKRTADPTPGPSPSPGDVVLGPGGLFLPVGGGFAGGQGGGGPGIAVGGEGRVIEQDLEVWANRTCTRAPGPPLGPFPEGQHMGVPLRGATDAGLALFADGCVECEVPLCCGGVTLPERCRVILSLVQGSCLSRYVDLSFVINKTPGSFNYSLSPSEPPLPILCPFDPSEPGRTNGEFNMFCANNFVHLLISSVFFDRLGGNRMNYQLGFIFRIGETLAWTACGSIGSPTLDVSFSCDPFFLQVRNDPVVRNPFPFAEPCEPKPASCDITVIPEP
jgi:hypothetical protein